MKIKTPLDYELEKSHLERRLESCKFFSVGVTGLLMGLILLLSAMLFFCKTAHAGAFGEVGTAEYKMPPNRLWWQDVDGYEMRKKMTDNYARVGYEFPINKNIGFRTSVFSLGKYSLYAEVNTNEPCIVKHGTGSKSKCGPSEGVETRGAIRGVALTAIVRTSGETRLFAEGGITWNRQAFHLYQCSLCFDLKNTYNETRKGGGYMVAVGVERGPWSLSAFQYGSNAGVFDSGNYPSGIGEVRGISLGYRF